MPVQKFYFFLALCHNRLLQSHIQLSNALLCFPFIAGTVPYTYDFWIPFLLTVPSNAHFLVTVLTTQMQHGFHSKAVLVESEDENNVILPNDGDCFHSDTAYHPKRLESLAIPL